MLATNLCLVAEDWARPKAAQAKGWQGQDCSIVTLSSTNQSEASSCLFNIEVGVDGEGS